MSPSSRISAWKVNGPACAFEADGASPPEEEEEELLAPCRWTLLHSTIRAVPVEEREGLLVCKFSFHKNP